MHGLSTIVGLILIASLITIVLFLIFREAVCWYFKINERLGQLAQIEVRLGRISEQLGSRDGASDEKGVKTPASRGAAPTTARGAGRDCPNCGVTNGEAMNFCQSCGSKLAV